MWLMIRLKFWLKVARYAPLWCLIWVLLCPLWVVGLFLTPIGIIFAKKSATGDILNPPRWMWLWGNDQEGYDPRWYQIYRAGWPRWFRMWEWAALRNSVNNIRYVPWLNPDPATAEVDMHFSSHGAILYTTGPFARLIVTFKGGDLLVGWKMPPMAPYWDSAARAVYLQTDPLPWGFGARYRKRTSAEAVWWAQDQARRNGA
jgi:hypothetical protein